MSLPKDGSVAEFNVPFKTMEEEENVQFQTVIPSAWAALCLYAEPNAAGKVELKITRLNALSIFQPNAVKLCGSAPPKV